MYKIINKKKGGSRGTPKSSSSKIRCNRIPASGVIRAKKPPECHPCPAPVAPPKMDLIPDKIDPKNITCTKTTYQRAKVSVPVVVKPISFAGPTTTLCKSEPVIKDIRCTGTDNQVCYFTIVQEICVEVPIHFGANATVGLPSVDCLPVSLDNCCHL